MKHSRDWPPAPAARYVPHMPFDDRLIELEIRIAHQDKVIEALDDVVRAFAARVEKLEREVETLRKSAGGLTVGPPDEPPPHY
jgi:SlyX protein